MPSTRASEAAADAQTAATKQGRRLPKEELKAAVEVALALTPVAATPTPAEQQASSFTQLQRRWIDEQVSRPRGQSGKPMAKKATLQRFLDYEQATGQPLDIERMDTA